MQVKFNQPSNQAMNREREIAASWLNTVLYKGRVTLPNQMNFWKGSKRPFGIDPTPKNVPYLWKS